MGGESRRARVVALAGVPSPETSDVIDVVRREADALGLDFSWQPTTRFDPDAAVAALKTADVGIIDADPYGEDIFAQIAGRCRTLIRFGAGFDSVDLEAASRHGIAVSRTSGANATGVADLAIALTLAARRQLVDLDAIVRDARWEKPMTRELVGASVGIVGFGPIGQEFERLLRGFRCRVQVYETAGRPLPEGVTRAEQLDELLASSDVVSLHVPYRPENHHLIDERRLRLMRPGATLVNTSRGGIVDEAALVRVLEDGHLGSAGFDVFATEPLPEDAVIRSAPRTVLTPHVASQTAESVLSLFRMAVDIAAKAVAGEPIPHLLNVDVLSRSA